MVSPTKNSPKVITVFGGSGFIGRYVVSMLARDGWQVRVPTRDPQGVKYLLPSSSVGQVVPIAVDIRDQESITHVVAGSSAVINLVGILFESGRQRFDILQSQLPGLVGTAARDCQVSAFVQMSAIGADLNSASAYGRTKGEGEEAAREGFPGVTVIRPSIVFGPEDDFFNRFAKMASVSPFLPLVGGGEVKFQPVFVQNVAEAILKAVNDPEKYGGKTYELGGPRILSFRECLESMLKHVNCRRLLVPLPLWLAWLQALFFELLPQPPLTRDQLKMLERDNVVSREAMGFRDFGIDPVDVRVVLPTYLSRYREGGK
ncbi:complex I NDUFA9 subunit family protein [Kiloniella sp.]|uniref:complex I NDUFA9 subunit family protein n=1 Tax=Kiloniella sp. TaxID=1938587 RepID=UPI003B01C5E1